MFFYKNKFIFSLVAILFLGTFFLISDQKVFSAEESINVNMTVPSDGGGGGGGGGEGETDSYPIISNVTVTSTQTTALVNWQATDDKGISTVQFVYGLSVAYGNSGTVSGSYETSLSGLTANTLYYYKISVTDSVGQVTNYTGTFSTLPIPPPPPDTEPPIISNVVVTPNITSAGITWNTNESANSQILYGLTSAYGSSAIDNNLVLNHSVNLVDLIPNTTYHYKIFSTDGSGNSASTVDATFTTLPDAVSPPNVSNLQIQTNLNSFTLTWLNPSLAVVPDFAGVKILRKVSSSSANVGDGTLVYSGGAQIFVDSNVLPNVNYYYTVFSFDTSNNYSSGVYVNGQIIPPVVEEICGNGLDDDGNGLIDCADQVCSGLPSCNPPQEICNNGVDDDLDGLADCADSNCQNDPACLIPVWEICDNNADDDGDGLVDCNDGDCSGLPICQPIIPGADEEICNNGIDDDGDNLVDCLDGDCTGFAGCIIIGGKLACEDGVDNDSDGLIDFPNDPGCLSLDDNSEMDIPIPTVPGFAEISFSDLIFLAGNRNIKLIPVNSSVSSLAGSAFTIGVPKSILVGPFESMFVDLGEGGKHQFVYDAEDDVYYADLIFPAVGTHEVYLRVDYSAEQMDTVVFSLQSLPWGKIQSESSEYLTGADVFLYDEKGVLMPMNNYNQKNPFLTNGNGSYGWVVPNGKYYLIVKKENFYDRKTPVFSIGNNVINRDIFLVVKPKKIIEVLDPDATLGENTQKVVENLLEKTKVSLQITRQEIFDTAETVKEVADNPVVEKTAERVIAPTAVAVTTVGTVVLISWANLLALLRFLFLQPIFLLGRRKREGWGEVYNTLDKMPIDLATVRLLNAVTNKIVQSRVTDMAGRYMFIVKPGDYKMTVNKSGFVFPSVLLKDFRSDGSRLDIYHGEVVNVTENDTSITANIPLDPVGATKPPARIRWEKFGRSLQNVVAWVGLGVTIVSLYISPKWYIWILLFAHLATFYLFRRLANPSKPKGWGIVYDKNTGQPIVRAVARLFDSQFNKLVATEITDRQGRYAFLAGENRYYITYEHENYEKNKTEIIDLKGKKSNTLAVDIALEKQKK